MPPSPRAPPSCSPAERSSPDNIESPLDVRSPAVRVIELDTRPTRTPAAHAASGPRVNFASPPMGGLKGGSPGSDCATPRRASRVLFSPSVVPNPELEVGSYPNPYPYPYPYPYRCPNP